MSITHSATYRSIRRQLRKRVESGTGFSTVPDGYEEADISVEVDTAAIARLLGVKAMGNKSGVAKECNGLVIVRVIRRARVAT